MLQPSKLTAMMVACAFVAFLSLFVSWKPAMAEETVQQELSRESEILLIQIAFLSFVQTCEFDAEDTLVCGESLLDGHRHHFIIWVYAVRSAYCGTSEVGSCTLAAYIPQIQSYQALLEKELIQKEPEKVKGCVVSDVLDVSCIMAHWSGDILMDWPS